MTFRRKPRAYFGIRFYIRYVVRIYCSYYVSILARFSYNFHFARKNVEFVTRVRAHETLLVEICIGKRLTIVITRRSRIFCFSIIRHVGSRTCLKLTKIAKGS